MGKNQRKAILQLIYLLLFCIGISIVLLHRLDFIYLIIALILPAIITGILSIFIPIKKSKNKKKSTKNVSKVKNKDNNNIPPTRLLSDKEIIKMPLEKMSGLEFERLCYLYYKAKGYKPKETKKGADGGVDLLIYQRYHQQYEAVQIKHYFNSGNQITVREIRELNSSKQNHDCVLARFITTSTYSKEAMLQADKWRMKTHSIDWVRNKIEPWKEEEAKKARYA
ncbi:restriction endonuclease [Gracilibacillus sp. S3-1-1]|uniref:Restriction endonuclease n=1 Tax=Gracilibacillus pellucidus TaxID=3095368 RepID=A0ACC6M6V5_9BACI|nr:restriction endonuclease [Gracilibacillus sp. S3-1-1]MDX8046631.1 restriction endonuclease [Gracilibacillus sp. S3-1-1]